MPQVSEKLPYCSATPKTSSILRTRPQRLVLFFVTKKVYVDGLKVRLQLWDTAGQERFRSMAPMYYRGANAALLMYDITSVISFEDIRGWLEELKKNCSTDLIIYIVGSKADLQHCKQVSSDLARLSLHRWFPPPRPPTPPPPPQPSTFSYIRPRFTSFPSIRSVPLSSPTKPSPPESSSSNDTPTSRASALKRAYTGPAFPAARSTGALALTRAKSTNGALQSSRFGSHISGRAWNDAGDQDTHSLIEDYYEDDEMDDREWGLGPGMELFEVSAKDDLGIQQLFDSLIGAIIQKKDSIEQENEIKRRDSVFLTPMNPPTWSTQADEEEAREKAAARHLDSPIPPLVHLPTSSLCSVVNASHATPSLLFALHPHLLRPAISSLPRLYMFTLIHVHICVPHRFRIPHFHFFLFLSPYRSTPRLLGSSALLALDWLDSRFLPSPPTCPSSMALVPPTSPARDPTEEDDDVCSPEHCFHSFDALYCALTNSNPISPKFPDEKYPLFVTWNTRSSRPGRAPRLRGCIGNFEAMPLHSGLAEYALISAFRDHRFRKIEKRELESLECGYLHPIRHSSSSPLLSTHSISLLTDFEDAASYLDWTVGVHGIYITFPHPSTVLSSGTPSPLSSSASLLSSAHLSSKHSFSATYLPQIALEQGWDKIETIDSAIQKAGWNGQITEDLRRSVKLRRYQSRKCTVGWDEYVEWRLQNGDRTAVQVEWTTAAVEVIVDFCL
ncbi:hypothetical protein EW146_g2903 [Bondarzewia mesenterica]|uniref:AMMECR1 domain-containing protein n=1 Tax=Bondarzewia mesenterica TaxID=1095465 RepID=A0A4V3XFL7_9AGAM|nr:hypothetical protein EW146_g2903 [Bondarzewia mesenterica]